MKHFRHTPAFTMLELVFVVAVVGIISALALPRFDRDNLQEAADQLASHIRYTQHLAMQDDKFDPNDNSWYLERWQIRFSTAAGTHSYSIMSDITKDGNPNASVGGIIEVAVDPLDQSKFLIGTETTAFFNNTSKEKMNMNLDLGDTYGVSVVVAGGTTGSNASRIIFDEMGRPYRGSTNAGVPASVISGPADRLATSRITVTLTDSTGNNIQIAIEPETGYTHIL